MSDKNITSGVPSERMLGEIRGQAAQRGNTPATPAMPTPASAAADRIGKAFGAPSDQTLQNIRRGALDRAPR